MMDYGSVSELAGGETRDRGYLGQISMLALLAPDLMEAILDGEHPKGMKLPGLLKEVAVEWGSSAPSRP